MQPATQDANEHCMNTITIETYPKRTRNSTKFAPGRKKKKSTRKATNKKKKITAADLKRKWNVPVKVDLRYKGIAGIYWYWLSRQVREDDFKKYHGKCVSCKAVTSDWHNWDCGHFVASGQGGFLTRFLRQNLALQCKKCNNPMWTPDAPAFYAVELDRRWGQGTAEGLLDMKGIQQKEMKPEQYEEAIKLLPSYQNSLCQTTKE